MDISPEGFDRLRDLISDPPPAPAAGGGPSRRIGKYRLRREVGRGGMAVVYEAEDVDLRRIVALKVVRQSDATPYLVSRLRREASIIAQLRHPHIVGVHEVGTARDEHGSPVHYIAMDFVKGRTLAHVLQVEQPAQQIALRLMEDIARAVAYAHSCGIIHRDLKPGNVLVDSTGKVQLVDFGLAYGEDFRTRLTASQSVLGTPQYMAPEQVRGDNDQVGPHTDVYALGVMLYEILAGKPPFTGRSAAELFARVLHENPEPLARVAPQTHPQLAVVCGKAMEKDPARRYPTAAEFADDLARARFDQPIQARAPGLGRRLHLLLAGRWAVAAALATGVLALAALVAVLLPQVWSQSERAVQQLRRRTQTALDASLALRRAGSLDQMQRFAEETEAACRETMRQFPDLAEPHAILGLMYRAMMRDEEAREAQEAALDRDGDLPVALYERIVLTVAERERRLKELRPWSWQDTPTAAIVEATRREAEADATARRLLARVESDCARLRRAVAAGRTGVGAGEVAAAEGLLAWIRGDAAGARMALTAALEQAPDLEEARFALATVEVSEQHYEAAVRIWDQGIARDRGFVPHLEGRGFAELAWGVELARDGRDAATHYAAAARDYAAAIATGQAQRETRLRLGIAQVLAGLDRVERGLDPAASLAPAIQALDAARGNAPEASVLIWRGIAQTAWGRWRGEAGQNAEENFQAAERDFAEARRLEPDDAGALVWTSALTITRALIANRLREDAPSLEQVIADLDRAVAAAPADADARMWRGTARIAFVLLQSKEEQVDETVLAVALADLDESIRLSPRTSVRWCRRGQLRLVWGAVAIRRNLSEPAKVLGQAIEDYLKGVELNPASYDGWLGLARARLLLADQQHDHNQGAETTYRAAIEAGERARTLSPLPRVLEVLGQAWEGLVQEYGHRNLGAIEACRKAIECYEAAIKAAPTAEARLRPRVNRLRVRLRR